MPFGTLTLRFSADIPMKEGLYHASYPDHRDSQPLRERKERRCLQNQMQSREQENAQVAGSPGHMTWLPSQKQKKFFKPIDKPIEM